MNTLVETAAVAPVVSALVNLFKFALPAAPSWAIALVSLLAGIGGAFIVSLALGHILTTQLAAQDTVLGVLVALAAAGLDRGAAAAQAQREAAQTPRGLAGQPRVGDEKW